MLLCLTILAMHVESPLPVSVHGSCMQICKDNCATSNVRAGQLSQPLQVFTDALFPRLLPHGVGENSRAKPTTAPQSSRLAPNRSFSICARVFAPIDSREAMYPSRAWCRSWLERGG
jgi:hypothetical protein